MLKNVKLKELGEIFTGSTPSKKNKEFYNSEDIMFIKPDILDFDIVNIGVSNEYISEKAREKARIIPANSLLVSCIGSIGKLGINEKEVAFNQQINAIVPNNKIKSSRYLAYLLKYNQKKLESIANAPVVPIINKTQFSEFEVLIHENLNFQEQITQILDKSKEIIEKRKEQIQFLDKLVKSKFIEMFGDPVINPKGWKYPKIEEVVANEKNAIKAGPFGSALKKEYYIKSGYKIYGQEQVISGDINLGDYYISEEKYKELENYAIKSNDVLISLVGTYGKLLIVPTIFEAGIINPRLMKITFNSNLINTIYFKFFFQSESLRNRLSDNTHGGTMPILNVGIVRNINIPIPPIELQNQFADFVKQVDKLKFEMEKSLKDLEDNFNSLMQNAFKGELFN
ncbi:restriction endonuclease subunit S [Clostridium perfringens]|uniref:restriction endonuclease subunit S n=1 Tax=Clostridium perfringens TaxID=1502 RepID=UPI000E122C97|nr:restriction endonuclease subunit S [Clostridium perfringens]MBI6012532.1 restriction endonuclease subunit S [Clostridium perfringens]UBK84275.1 restriction endonuclease subunit S [Clostridium perfringens]SUY32997.1 type I restriction-modification system subunit S [Clostridium perfringens]